MSTKNVGILDAELRTRVGTRAARALRASGRIPAMIEAQDQKPHLDLSVDEEAFLASRRQHQHVYEIKCGGTSETALVRKLDWNVFGERIDHIEFRRVDLTKRTEVEVEIAFLGHPKGVLNHLVTHVTVRALPLDIPDEVECSVADLEIGAIVHARELKVPAGVELVTAPETLIARISELKVDLGPALPAEAVPAEGAAAVAPAAAAGAPAAGGPGGSGAAAAAPAAAPEKKGGDKK